MLDFKEITPIISFFKGKGRKCTHYIEIVRKKVFSYSKTLTLVTSFQIFVRTIFVLKKMYHELYNFGIPRGYNITWIMRFNIYLEKFFVG